MHTHRSRATLNFTAVPAAWDGHTSSDCRASHRAQLLARTIRGMACYHSALKLLVDLEFPDMLHGARKRVAALRYQHVVAAQAFGAQRKSSKPADRLRARGIAKLLMEHPALRVAYIDSGGEAKPSYSVLLRVSAHQTQHAGVCA